LEQRIHAITFIEIIMKGAKEDAVVAKCKFEFNGRKLMKHGQKEGVVWENSRRGL